MLLKKEIDNKIFFLIHNETQFQNYLLDKSNSDYNVERNYLLINHLDLNNIPLEFKNPIEKYSGIFDGGNKTIFNFSLNCDPKSSHSYIGFFSYLKNSTIKNLTIRLKLELYGESMIGGMVGHASDCKFMNCNLIGHFNIAAINGYNIGLFAGKISSSCLDKINIVASNSIIRGHHNIGGFSGLITKTEISNSFICGQLTLFGINLISSRLNFIEKLYTDSDNEYSKCLSRQIGGFIGNSILSSIIKCNATFNGSIIGFNYIGGFVGVDNNSVFEKCCMEVNGNILKTNIPSNMQSNIEDSEVKPFFGIFCTAIPIIFFLSSILNIL